VRAGSLALIAGLIALPSAASDVGDTAKVPSVKAPRSTPTLNASMTTIVARELAAVKAAPAAARRQQNTRSVSFFKTRPGIIAAAVMIAGTGYALYSTTHDRIHSAGKQ
jgi:hypothetical protein